MGDDIARTRFGLLDVLQLFSGLIILNAILSYTFTSSTVWGYDNTRYVDPAYIMFIIKGSPMKYFTPEMLKTETEISGRLLLSINKKIFDVTRNREMYDSKYLSSRYSTFIGNDCTRMYINGCFKDINQCTWDLRNIGYDDKWVNKTVLHWEEFYRKNLGYWQVGYLDIGDEKDYEIPKKCLNGMKYPRI